MNHQLLSDTTSDDALWKLIEQDIRAYHTLIWRYRIDIKKRICKTYRWAADGRPHLIEDLVSMGFQHLLEKIPPAPQDSELTKGYLMKIAAWGVSKQLLKERKIEKRRRKFRAEQRRLLEHDFYAHDQYKEYLFMLMEQALNGTELSPMARKILWYRIKYPQASAKEIARDTGTTEAYVYKSNMRTRGILRRKASGTPSD